MITLSVALGERSYPLFMAENLLVDADLFAKILGGRPFVIVSSQNLKDYASALAHTLKAPAEA